MVLLMPDKQDDSLSTRGIYLLPNLLTTAGLFSGFYAVVSSMNGLTKYGTFGKGGIIVINTKTARFEPKDENGEIIDVARVQDNKYFDNALENKDAINDPTYLQELYAAKDQQEAIFIYKANAKKYSSSYFYFLDAYDYFANNFKNQSFADNIIAEHWSLFEERDMMEEWLAYERFEEAGLETMSCPFVGCKWHQDFTINYTLLTKGEEE